MKKDVNLDIKSLLGKAKGLAVISHRYTVVAFIVVIVGLYGFLILQISEASQKEPSSDQVLQELGSVKRLHIDQDSIDKIQKLQDQNVQVQSLFEKARKNPFSETID